MSDWDYYLECYKRGLSAEGKRLVLETRGIDLSNFAQAPISDDGGVAILPYVRNGVPCLFKLRIFGKPNMWCVKPD